MIIDLSPLNPSFFAINKYYKRKSVSKLFKNTTYLLTFKMFYP